MGTDGEAICAVLLGIAGTEEEARQVADTSRGCPYAVCYLQDGNLVVGVYVLPEAKRWWAQVPEENPETAGVASAQVFITDQVLLSSPWSRREVEPILEQAPCLADCPDCPYFASKCSGCPATVHHRGVASS